MPGILPSVCVCVQSVFGVCACALTISLLMLNMLLAQCVEGLMWNHCGDASGRGMELLCRILEPIDRHSQCNCPCAFLSVKLLSVSARAHVAAERERDLGGGGNLRGGERESSERVTKRPQEELTTGFPKAVCLKASAEVRLQSSCATPCA
jgi:hypothetical protein